MRSFRLIFFLSCAVVTFTTGCGSGKTTMTNQPVPGASQPAPAPAGGSGTAQFTESMLANDGSARVAGQVVINQNGTGTANVSGALANTSYNLQFCPFADMNGTCNTLTTATSSMAGAVSASFTVPGHGGFTGIFQLASGSMVGFVSAFNVPANGSTLQAALVRASTVTNGFGVLTQNGLGVGFDPLTSGLVNVSNGDTAHVQLQGAVANASYDVTFCRNGGGSSCFGIGGINTDAAGNGTADLSLSSGLGTGTYEAGAFVISSGKPPAIEFVSGFTVP